MKRKLLISVLSSLAIVLGAFGFAYAAGTFKASNEGFRPAGAGQAMRLTMRVEAGMADANSDLVPDDIYASAISPGPGGALSFSIKNTNDVPLRVTKVEQATGFCYVNSQQSLCPIVTSNKNGAGTYDASGTGDCKQYVTFLAPGSYDNWPTIAPHSTLEVNGTDNNRLGAGMIHLTNATAQGCQGAVFALTLNVTAVEWTPRAYDTTAP
jgi:hypothetical protein